MSNLKIYRGTIDNLRTNLETNVSGSVRKGKGDISLHLIHIVRLLG